jgi:putative tryptophan/tyrosine transport system ATP-binding protein
MVKLESVYKIFSEGTINENTALKKVNLIINEKDFITIIGSNGAGKTTLFNIISGNISCSHGTISIDNGNITRHPEYKRAQYIGRIFQNPLLGTAANMTIEENMIIAYKKGLRGLTLSLNNQIRSQFKKELKLLDMGLEDRLNHKVGLLSGGQRQALTLLMTVMSRPRLLLLDEHTAALDPKNADLILKLTKKFIVEYELTAMMITHNMNHAIKYGNRLLMMDKGEIISDIREKEKKSLTVDKLVSKFYQIRHENLDNDDVLLSTKE